MSKTYRRKNDTWNFSANDYRWENGCFQCVPMNVESKEFKKEKARFHSDNYTGWSVPHWYVNMFYERTNRRNAKKALHKWKKLSDNYDVLLNPHMKNAGWTYW